MPIYGRATRSAAQPPLALHCSVPVAGAGCLDIANASQAQKARMLYGSARSCHTKIFLLDQNLYNFLHFLI